MPEIEIWKNVIAWGIANTKRLPSNVDEWTKNDFEKLGSTLVDLLPLIRFIDINSTDFYHEVLPYKKVLPKDLFKEILQFHLDSNYDPSKGKLRPARDSVFDSVLVSDKQHNWIVQHIKKASKETFPYLPHLDLLYRGTCDGFTASDFHRLCDNIGPTVTVIMDSPQEKLFGGYSPLDWNSTSQWGTTDQSFIFALGDSDLDGAVLSVVSDQHHAVCSRIASGPIFGNGPDLRIGDEGRPFDHFGACSIRKSSYFAEIHPDVSFEIDEIEVFRVRKSPFF
jgi:hypothetical protein